MIKAVEIKDYAVYAPGQFVIIEQYFMSTVSLAGRRMYIGVKFDDFEDCDEEKPDGLIPFDFPFGAGEVEIPISNYALKVEALDDRRFRVEYQFFNTGTSSTNGCSVAKSPGMLGIAVGYEDLLAPTETQLQNDPCRAVNTCWHGTCANIALLESEFQDQPIIKYFDDQGGVLNGYNLAGPTVLRFEIPGQIGNTFYISFCSNYAQINQGASQVGTLPIGSITGGRGFVTIDGKTFGTVEFSTLPGTTGYIVYSNGCTWQAAKFQLIPNTLRNQEPEIYPPTYGDVTCELTVNDEVVQDCCVGVRPGQAVGIRLEMDTDQYNSMITSNGTYGSYGSNFSSVGMCISETPVMPDQPCDGQVTHNNGIITTQINVQSDWENKPIYVNFQWRFQIRTPGGIYEDVINKVVLLNVGAETGINLIEYQDEEGDPITGTICLDEVDQIKAVIEGEEGQQFTIDSDLSISPTSGVFGSEPTELTISTEGVQPFTNRCFTIEGEGEVEDSDENPANCSANCSGVDVDVVVTDTGSSGWKAFLNMSVDGTNVTAVGVNGESFPGDTAGLDIEGEGEPAIIVIPLSISVITSDGCAYLVSGYIEVANELGATNSGSGDCETVEIPFEAPNCAATLGISMTCNDGSMSISGTGTAPDITSDNLQFQGGGTTSSNRFDLAIRTVETQNCGTMVIYECFNCEPEINWEQLEECEDNSELAVEWSFDGVELTLTPTNDPENPLTDVIEYSLDGGASWVQYTAPVVVPVEVEEIPIRRIATFADCEDAVFEDVVGKDCDFSVTIDWSGDDLELEIEDYIGNSVPAFRWEKETPSGVVPFGTTKAITPDENGIYRGFVTLDGCEKEAYMLVIQSCTDFMAWIGSVTPSGSSYTLKAQYINAPSSVVFEWYQWSGGQYALIGTGASVQTNQVGTVKLIARSGVCVKEDLTEIAMDFVNPWYYQKFILTGNEDHVEVTEFTLPDVDNLHPDRVAFLMEVNVSLATYIYEHQVTPANVQRGHYSIDGQDVNLQPAYMKAGDVVVVKMKDK